MSFEKGIKQRKEYMTGEEWDRPILSLDITSKLVPRQNYKPFSLMISHLTCIGRWREEWKEIHIGIEKERKRETGRKISLPDNCV